MGIGNGIDIKNKAAADIFNGWLKEGVVGSW